MREKNLNNKHFNPISFLSSFLKLFSKKEKIASENSTSHSSIKKKFIITFVSFALIPFMSLCITYTIVSKNALRTTSRTLNLEIVHQVTNNLNTTLSSIETSILELGANSILKSGKLPAIVSNNGANQGAATLTIASLISKHSVAQPLLTETCLYLPTQNQTISSISGFTAASFNTYVEEDSTSAFHWTLPPELIFNEALVYKEFTDLKSGVNYYIFSKFPTTPFATYLNSLSLLKDSCAYLISSEGKLIFATDSGITELPSYISDNIYTTTELTSFSTNDYFIASDTLSNGWKLVVQTPFSSLTEQLDSAIIIIGGLLFLVIALAIILGFFYAQAFSAPIIGLMQLMRKAEKGDLTVEAPVKGNDEIAALCKSFNHMMHNIKALINQTQDVIVHTLSNSETLTQSTSHSVGMMEDLVTAVSEIAEGSTTQALDAQKSTQGMQGLAHQMDTVSGKTSTLLSNTQGAKSMIEDATSIIDSLTTTMSSSLQTTHEICTSIDELNKLNQNIENVIRLVDVVSEQTNLLAINASIEAAHVGEAGKGFAVVATEVRHLADQTKASTAEVRTTLNTIDKKMQSTVTLAEHSKQTILNQERVVQDTQQLFKKMIEILTSMLNELQDIHISVHDMRDLKEDMVLQIDSIASVAEESAASTQEVSSLASHQQTVMASLSTLSQELTMNMENLTKTINAFKVLK